MTRSATRTDPITRAPTLSYSILALGLVVFVAGVGALEAMAAARHIVARPDDSVGAWVQTYADGIADPGGALLLGSSRGALGFDPEVLSKESGLRTHNLTIDGGSPLPVLDRLVAEHYAGTVVVELMESRFFADDDRGRLAAETFVRELDNPSLLTGFEDRARRTLAAHFRTRSSSMRLINLLRTLPSGRLPEPAERHTRSDRFEFTDITRVDGPNLDERWAQQFALSVPYTGPALRAAIARYADIEHRIESHGGAVRWVRLPTSGRVREVEDALFRRAETFDQVGGPENRWHYEDDAATQGLQCFDGSHLTPEGATVLSRAVGSWLRERATDVRPKE